jgi:hypothetical protein
LAREYSQLMWEYPPLSIGSTPLCTGEMGQDCRGDFKGALEGHTEGCKARVPRFLKGSEQQHRGNSHVHWGPQYIRLPKILGTPNIMGTPTYGGPQYIGDPNIFGTPPSLCICIYAYICMYIYIYIYIKKLETPNP